MLVVRLMSKFLVHTTELSYLNLLEGGYDLV